jgi:hypothetical protein
MPVDIILLYRYLVAGVGRSVNDHSAGISCQVAECSRPRSVTAGSSPRPWRCHAGVVAVPHSQVPPIGWEGTETEYFPRGDLDGEILNAIHQTVPDGATYAVNHDFRRAWIRVSRPGDTREVLRAAFASLSRDLPSDPGDG